MSWRTLQCIGWRYAEPVMRFLTYALHNYHGDPSPARSDLEADKPWRNSLELVDQIRRDWLSGEIRSEATSDLLSTMRTGSWAEASQQVVELLNRGVAASFYPPKEQSVICENTSGHTIGAGPRQTCSQHERKESNLVRQFWRLAALPGAHSPIKKDYRWGRTVPSSPQTKVPAA